MAPTSPQLNGKSHIVTGIKEVPITQERPPAIDLSNFVQNPGVARVNVAPSREKPEGQSFFAQFINGVGVCKRDVYRVESC